MTILIDADGCPVFIRTYLGRKRHQPELMPFVGGDGGHSPAGCNSPPG